MDHELVNHSFSIIHRHPCIETQDLGKDQTLAALAAEAALISTCITSVCRLKESAVLSAI